MILLMLAQAAGSAQSPAPPEALAPIDFDLRTVKPETGLFGNMRGAITAEQAQLPARSATARW